MLKKYSSNPHKMVQARNYYQPLLKGRKSEAWRVGDTCLSLKPLVRSQPGSDPSNEASVFTGSPVRVCL